MSPSQQFNVFFETLKSKSLVRKLLFPGSGTVCLNVDTYYLKEGNIIEIPKYSPLIDQNVFSFFTGSIPNYDLAQFRDSSDMLFNRVAYEITKTEEKYFFDLIDTVFNKPDIISTERDLWSVFNDYRYLNIKTNLGSVFKIVCGPLDWNFIRMKFAHEISYLDSKCIRFKDSDTLVFTKNDLLGKFYVFSEFGGVWDKSLTWYEDISLMFLRYSYGIGMVVSSDFCKVYRSPFIVKRRFNRYTSLLERL